MNTTMLLNNVLTSLANYGARSSARNSSSFDAGPAKSGTILQDQPLSPQKTPSDNLRRIDTETQSKSASNTDFKNILNRQIKSRKLADESARSDSSEPVSQQTDAKIPQQDSIPTSDVSQPVETPVTTNEASIIDSLIPDIAISGNTTPASNASIQSVAAPQAQIADTLIINSPSTPTQNQPQSPQPDSSQQTQPAESQQPALDTSQLITTPDKPNISAQQKTENVVSPDPSVIRNLSSDNSIPNANLESKPADVTSLKTPTEGQMTQTDFQASAHSGHLAVTSSSLSKKQTDNTPAESPDPNTINITKANPDPESRHVKTDVQTRLNQHTQRSEDPASESAILNQQSNQPDIAQDKTGASLEKPDTLKADLQNINTTSQIARGQAIPESSINITDTAPAKLPAEALHNLSAANNDPAGAIREQITQSVTTAAQQLNRQITVQLNPPELGKVSVKFSQAGSELTGLIETSNPRTRADINQQIPEILRSLEQAGVTVKRIDVTLSDLPGRSNPDSHRDNSSQLNWNHSGNNYHDSGSRHFSSDSYTTSPQYLSTSSEYESRVTSHEPRILASSSLDILI